MPFGAKFQKYKCNSTLSASFTLFSKRIFFDSQQKHWRQHAYYRIIKLQNQEPYNMNRNATLGVSRNFGGVKVPKVCDFQERWWSIDKVKQNNLITVPVGPASKPVVVGQALDGAQCSNCNILQITNINGGKTLYPEISMSHPPKFISLNRFQ